MNASANRDALPSAPVGIGSIVQNYLELIRFSHTIFALPFAILVSVWAWMLTVRQGDQLSITWLSALGILVCMVAARSFAMAVNRLADARLDGLNPRTAGRHLPSGRLSFSGWKFQPLTEDRTFARGKVMSHASAVMIPKERRNDELAKLLPDEYESGFLADYAWCFCAHGIAPNASPE